MMDRIEELFKQGNNCCQIITTLLAEQSGFDPEEARSQLGATMCSTCGGTCSTLRGGTYCITKYCEENGISHERSRELVDTLYEQFRSKHGGILCKEIAKNDIMVCAGFVQSVIEMTGNIIEEAEKSA